MNFFTIIIYTSIYIGLIATSFYVLSFFSNIKKKKRLFTDDELPKVSILIPAFNEEKSIEGTIKSVLATDYPKNKLEIIVIDDGSIDNTLKIAKKFQGKHEGKIIKVFTKKNGGKGSALNFGIKKSIGEIIFSMDADTFVHPESVKKMVRYFKNKQVMSVTPGITIYKPKTILQRIQQSEYLLGLFLRKTFATLNAIHITPGAFSAYRKNFFERYGGYDEDNITEDLELALRIQLEGYIIENSPEAQVQTIAPKKFFHLLKQRRRWYVGLMRNTLKYKKIFSSKYGDLGMFVMPVAWISIFFAVFVTSYLAVNILRNIQEELVFLSSINFDFSGTLNLSFYALERFFFLILTNPVIIFIGIFLIILRVYLIYASKKQGKIPGIEANLYLFLIFFALLFGFWWIVSIIYALLNRKVSWK